MFILPLLIYKQVMKIEDENKEWAKYAYFECAIFIYLPVKSREVRI